METLIVIAEASIFIGVIYLINQFFGGKHIYSRYFVGFLVMCGILFAFKGQAHASNKTYERYVYDYYNFDRHTLTENERRLFVEQMDKSERYAKYHYQLAKDRSWWLPDVSDREKARYCFTGAVANILACTPQSKVVATIGTFLTAYGLACLDEWNYINDNLMKSQVWWESYEFYKYALEHG